MADEALHKTIQELRAQVSQLSRRVEELSQAVERKHSQREATLKSQLRCPACGGRRVLHASEILDRTDGTQHRMAVMAVGFWVPKPRGLFECYVCVQCGFVEWYVKEPASVEPDDKIIHIIEADEDNVGPYR